MPMPIDNVAVAVASAMPMPIDSVAVAVCLEHQIYFYRVANSYSTIKEPTFWNLEIEQIICSSSPRVY